MKKWLKRFSIAVILVVAVAVVLLNFANNRVEHFEYNSFVKAQDVGRSVWEYQALCGKFPTTAEGLSTLTHMTVCGKPFHPLTKYSLVDHFHVPFIYESDGATFKIGSLGLDKKVGGIGVDRDFWVTSADDVGQNKK